MTSRHRRSFTIVSALVVVAWSGCNSPAPSEKTIDQRCVVDTYVENDCDLCENTNCCTTRFACYDDHDCFYANLKLDKCLAAATSGDAGVDGDAADAEVDGDAADAEVDGGADDAGDAASAIAKCWDDFAQTDDVSRARRDCQRLHCQAACEVP